ncbi:helix-turn-helix domain-containing protein [Reichenbachiella versicolor]|uniref:helix-turn-helix domain-containing protein n=1 Tax=Reichenbachiella versicolor TaxID=1821036 RepID=UPI000D6E9FD1|nr:AraC family transcriptional regulator [Reichenbachiella versicolor]
MILKKESFQYKDKVLIEKAYIKPPYKHGRVFQNEGCFIHLKGATGKLMSSEDSFDFTPNLKEAILLKCDTYFLDFVKSTSEEAVEVIAIHLYPDLLKALYANEIPATIKNNATPPKTNKLVEDETITRFIESLDFYFDNPHLVNDDLLELKVRELILLLVQTKNASSVLELIQDLYSKREANFKDVIKLHQFNNLEIEELARLTNLSVSSFKREFKKTFNNTPAKFFNVQKINKAKELLVVTNMTISEIAFEIGFNDPLYFTRIFKKSVSLSPSDFRKQQTQ